MISIILCMTLGMFYFLPSIVSFLRAVLYPIAVRASDTRRQRIGEILSRADGDTKEQGRDALETPIRSTVGQEVFMREPSQPRHEQVFTASYSTNVKIDSAVPDHVLEGLGGGQETLPESRPETSTGVSEPENSQSLWAELWAVATSVS
eukprot:766346-Hanusia_phi.AAC.4